MDKENEMHVYSAVLFICKECNYDTHGTVDKTNDDYAKQTKPDSL